MHSILNNLQSHDQHLNHYHSWVPSAQNGYVGKTIYVEMGFDLNVNPDATHACSHHRQHAVTNLEKTGDNRHRAAAVPT